ncbi:hypothetical protein E2C01_054018 [Portunus trituberculatus]|uniref:Uncharacterized protein n=1 Tax=Portunus trituberculatus TaxID=210409 RepID=A0A5B7GTU0_PORTR|nr:hypothetical protein [Portunus trituberculatus]
MERPPSRVMTEMLCDMYLKLAYLQELELHSSADVLCWWYASPRNTAGGQTSGAPHIPFPTLGATAAI